MLVYLPFTHYLTGSIIALLFFYIIIWLLYFRKKPSGQISKSQQAALFVETDSQNNIAISSNTEADLSRNMHDFVDELNTLLLRSAKEGTIKQMLSTYINKLLEKYEGLKGSPFQPAIMNLIAVEAENKCNIHFDADELAALWNPPS